MDGTLMRPQRPKTTILKEQEFGMNILFEHDVHYCSNDYYLKSKIFLFEKGKLCSRMNILV